MNLLITIVAFVFALGSLIIVHEYGHYVVARLLGVKVLRFSVGFGRVLWSRRLGRDQTEWALSAFPLGGYVKMLDEREGDVPQAELDRAFNRKSVYRRFAIVIAGPTANFLMAIVLYWVLFLHGVPGLKPVVGTIGAGSPAAAAQFRPGDVIVRIGSEEVITWQDARWQLLKHAVDRGSVRIEVQNEKGEIDWRNLDLASVRTDDLDSDFLRALGFVRTQPPMRPIIGRIIADGAAARAGLQADDEIVAIDGRSLSRWDEVVTAVSENPGRRLVFKIARAARTTEIAVTPDSVAEKGASAGRIGAAPRVDSAAMQKYLVEVRYPLGESLLKSLERTWDTSLFSLRMLGKMIVGAVSLKNLSGPITIADYAGQSAQIGWISYVAFLALISISLGVLNLLPIPLLDGGHLLYYMLEIVKGSPVSDKTMQIGQHIGVAVLFLLMAFALYNDINRLISS